VTSTHVRALSIGLVAVVAAVYIGYGLMTARETLGCDFAAYQIASDRYLHGQPLYDLSVTKTGECAQFQYPPPFVLLALPFAALGTTAGNAAWIAFLIGCFVIGCWVMPVSGGTRLAVFLAGSLSWPFIFGVRIGTVVPILYLLFAIGWRFLDRPAVTGIVAGIGTMVKLQPALILGWLAVRRSWIGLGAGLATIGLIALVAAAFGLTGWADLVTVLRNFSNALDIPANASLGAIAYQHGMGAQQASAVQAVATIVALALVVATGLRSSAPAGYLTAVVASQVASPIVWSHYALILLLPVAWLIEQRQWWAAAIPFALTWVLLAVMPIEIYPLVFYVTLIGVPVVDWRQRTRAERQVLAAA